MKEEEEEERQTDIIERAASVLCEEAWSDVHLVRQLLEKLMKVLRAEIVEKNEEDKSLREWRISCLFCLC